MTIVFPSDTLLESRLLGSIPRKEAMTETQKRRFNRPAYYPADEPDTNKRTLRQLVPRGSILFSVIRIKEDQSCRMRLYCADSIRRGMLRVDSLIGEHLFDELVSRVPYDGDQVDYNAFDSYHGSDSSGFGWPTTVKSNVPLGLVYTLAEIVHGERDAWQLVHL